MKNLFTLLTLLLVSNIIPAQNNNYKTENFYAMYNSMDSLPNIKDLVYNQVLNAQWIPQENTLIYKSLNKQGNHYYKLIIEGTDNTASPVEISLNEFNNLNEKIKDFQQQRRQAYKEEDNIGRIKEAGLEKYLSPDSLWYAILRDNNVWLQPSGLKGSAKDAKMQQLSFDGTANDFYQELSWSADSKKIAAMKKHDTPMHKIPLIESSPKTQLQPILQWRDYYKPGDAIPSYSAALFVIDNNNNAKQIPVDNSQFNNQYWLSFNHWSSDSKYFVLEYNARGHQSYKIANVCAESGKVNIVIDEKEKTFIHYYRNILKYISLNGSQKIIWSSERDGYRHLYLIDALTGNVDRQLTKGNWVTRDLIFFNDEPSKEYIILSGNGKNEKEDPYNLHYYKLDLNSFAEDGSAKITDLTPNKLNHTVTFNHNKTLMLDVFSAPNIAPQALVRDIATGKTVADLGKADISDLIAHGYTQAEVFTAKGRDGKTDIWGTIFKPSNFDPKKKYPVVEYIYAGPHDSFVLKDFYAYLRFSKLVEMGFIVVSIDGMGTANRSKAFHNVCWKNIKDSGFPDRILWIKAAAKKYKYMDITKGVGIYGYSAGGQSTLAALLWHNDFYKYGVALCGCHDNRMDKIWWNEQWMGYPIGPWYSSNSNVDNAHLLNAQLLIINGELDDNVDPTSTLQVVNALVKAGKHFEQLYLPSYTHNLGDKYVTGRVFEFLYRNMK